MPNCKAEGSRTQAAFGRAFSALLGLSSSAGGSLPASPAPKIAQKSLAEKCFAALPQHTGGQASAIHAAGRLNPRQPIQPYGA